MTPDYLRKLADQLDDEGLSVIEKDRAQALQKFTRAELLRSAADELEGLQRTSPKANVSSMHTDEHRMRISQSHADDPFFVAIRGAGYTLRKLASALGVSAPLLSQYRAGIKAIPRSRAERIEALTGFKAVGPNWPGGITG